MCVHCYNPNSIVKKCTPYIITAQRYFLSAHLYPFTCGPGCAFSLFVCILLTLTATFGTFFYLFCHLTLTLTLFYPSSSWSLRDICLTQPTPKVEEEFIQKILDHLFPCAIISPLDCFWEGSKLLSIKQPIEPPDYIRSVLPEFKWTSLNPQSLISSLKKLLSHEKSESSSSSSASATFHHLEKLEKIMNRVSINILLFIPHRTLLVCVCFFGT